MRVRVFITSRPDVHIRSHFAGMPEGIHGETLHKIYRLDGKGERKDDITTLVEHKLCDIREKYKPRPDWSDNEKVRDLVRKADGLFIYAATACRFLLKANQKSASKRLDMVIEGSMESTGRQNGLDEIYTRIFQAVLTGEDDNDQTMTDLFRAVVGPVIRLSKPLSIIALSRLIGVEITDIRWLLENLFSVMEISEDDNGTIALLHLSFRDFLLSPQRCCDHRF